MRHFDAFTTGKQTKIGRSNELLLRDALVGRLKEPQEMDAVFDCIQQCVRTIFRENFDSAFEHLGKIDGHVTQASF